MTFMQLMQRVCAIFLDLFSLVHIKTSIHFLCVKYKQISLKQKNYGTGMSLCKFFSGSEEDLLDILTENPHNIYYPRFMSTNQGRDRKGAIGCERR